MESKILLAHIEEATNPSLSAPNMELNFKICSIIDQSADM